MRTFFEVVQNLPNSQETIKFALSGASDPGLENGEKTIV